MARAVEVIRSTTALDWLPVAALPPVLALDAAVAHGSGPVTVLGGLGAVVGCLPLLVRRRVGVPAMMAMLTAGVVIILWLLKPHNTVVLVPMVALFELALRGDRRLSRRMAVSVIPCVVIGVVPFASVSSVPSIVLRNVVLCVLAIAAGDIVRSRRLAVERAAAARESAAQRRLDEERLRIARDVHDVVAHAMTAINVQAGVAAHLLERNPGQAYAALRSIKQVSGEALTDLRATLGTLREEPGGSEGERDIGALAHAAGTAGIDVALDADELAGLSPAVQSASYRIVQEALTNVVRHARAEHVWVTVRRLPDALTIEVRDDGAGSGAAPTPGNGLLGMRERALALGGSLEAAPADGRGWRVAARLPVEVA